LGKRLVAKTKILLPEKPLKGTRMRAVLLSKLNDAQKEKNVKGDHGLHERVGGPRGLKGGRTLTGKPESKRKVND